MLKLIFFFCGGRCRKRIFACGNGFPPFFCCFLPVFRDFSGVTKRFCLPSQLSPLFRLNFRLKKISEQKFVSKNFRGFAALKHSPKFFSRPGGKGSQLSFTTCFQCTHFLFCFLLYNGTCFRETALRESFLLLASL